MGEFSIMHWIVVLVILLLFFGPSRLPDLGKSLGKAIKGFKEGINEAQNALNKPEEKKSEQLENQKKDKTEV